MWPRAIDTIFGSANRHHIHSDYGLERCDGFVCRTHFREDDDRCCSDESSNESSCKPLCESLACLLGKIPISKERLRSLDIGGVAESGISSAGRSRRGNLAFSNQTGQRGH